MDHDRAPDSLVGDDSLPQPETCSRAATSDPHIDRDSARQTADASSGHERKLDADSNGQGRWKTLREIWSDVAFNPLERAEITIIPYSEEFAWTYGLLFAARQLGESSPRALDLCSRAILLNPSDVTAWTYRHVIVTKMCAAMCGVEGRHTDASMKLLESEFAYVERLAKTSPKNYQLWEHRRFLVCLATRNPNDEGSFVNAVLEEDEKNYHAWSHRAWLLNTSGIDLHAQLEDAQKLIETDVRNNSAWSFRWNVTDILERHDMDEMNWALTQMRIAPRNESVWNYIAALVKEHVGVDEAASAANDVLEKDHANVPARRHLVLYEGVSLSDKLAHCEKLATRFDSERYKYWCWKAEILRSRQAVFESV